MARNGSLGHIKVSSQTIIRSIEKLFPKIKQEELLCQKFGIDFQRDAQIALEASNAANRPIPDNLLSQFKTIGDLVKYVSREVSINGGKGIPWIEIFKCAHLPPNVTLINYHKRKWPEEHYKFFIERALSNLKP
jgi:hypothetical protein